MENQEIVRELLHEFKDSDLTSLEMESADLTLRLGRGGVEPSGKSEMEIRKEDSFTPEENTWEEIKAPLVGTFYAAPSPEDEPYVQEGQKVAKGDTLCILEAMKMMNELTAPYDLVVRNILGVNGEMAEYDQVLFEVERC